MKNLTAQLWRLSTKLEALHSKQAKILFCASAYFSTTQIISIYHSSTSTVKPISTDPKSDGKKATETLRNREHGYTVEKDACRITG